MVCGALSGFGVTGHRAVLELETAGMRGKTGTSPNGGSAPSEPVRGIVPAGVCCLGIQAWPRVQPHALTLQGVATVACRFHTPASVGSTPPLLSSPGSSMVEQHLRKVPVVGSSPDPGLHNSWITDGCPSG